MTVPKDNAKHQEKNCYAFLKLILNPETIP